MRKLYLTGFAGRLFLWFWLALTLLIVGNYFLGRYLDGGPHLRSPTEKEQQLLNTIEERINRRQLKNIQQLYRSRLSHGLVILDPQTGVPMREQRRHWRLAPLFDAKTQQVLVLKPGHRVVGPLKIVTRDNQYQGYWIMPPEKMPSWKQWMLDSPHWRLIGSVVIVLLLAIALAQWLSRPLRPLADAARRFGNGNLSVRVKPGKGEFGELAREFNAMADKLQNAMQSQQRLVADVSHELRSPLTRLKLAAGMLAERSPGTLADRIDKECDTLNHMIEQLLTLAKLESSVYHEPTDSIDLACLITSSIEDWHFQCSQFSIIYRGPEQFTCELQPRLMQSIVNNIFSNASRFASKLEVHLSADSGGWSLTFSDNGPGVDAEHLSQLFEPFYRADSARGHEGNFGLGLAIVKAATQAQHLTISAANSEQGGLSITIKKPEKARHPEDC